jgi:Glycosyl hydrolase family 26
MWLRLAVVGLVVAVVAAVAVAVATRQHGGGSPVAVRPPSEPVAPSGPLPPLAYDSLVPARGDLFGASVEPVTYTVSGQEAAVSSFEGTIGRKLAIDQLYTTWSAPMPLALASWDLRRGTVPLISWTGAHSDQILAGTYDAQLRTQALALKSLGGPVMLRYFAEMNNSFDAAATGSPARFIAAWRYIHGIFASAGATNVHWVWSPTSIGFATGDAQRFYPGDAYVNWIGADGYNWAPVLPKSTWRSFSDIFTAFYRWGEHTDKPMLIGEFGVLEGKPGAKAAWYRQADQQLRTQFPRIRAVVYFNSNHKVFSLWFNEKVTTSASALAAFRAFARDPYFSAQPLT